MSELTKMCSLTKTCSCLRGGYRAVESGPRSSSQLVSAGGEGMGQGAHLRAAKLIEI